MSTWDKVKKLLGFGPDCLNDGRKDNNGNCQCPKYFEGNVCGKIICLNDGKPNKSRSKCYCSDPDRFYGKHCESTRCENNGKDTGKGSCKCVDNWYTGRFCEQYSSPWAIVFGVLAAVVVLLIILCVLCRLKVCGRRRRSRRNSYQNGAAPARNRRLVSNSRRSTDAVHPNSRQNRPDWPPWPVVPGTSGEISAVERPPDYDGPKLESPPPSYDEVVKDLSRFPSADPSVHSTSLVISPPLSNPGLSSAAGTAPPSTAAAPPSSRPPTAPSLSQLEAGDSASNQSGINNSSQSQSGSGGPSATRNADSGAQRVTLVQSGDQAALVAPSNSSSGPPAATARTITEGEEEHELMEDDGRFDSDFSDEDYCERPHPDGPIYDSVPRS